MTQVAAAVEGSVHGFTAALTSLVGRTAAVAEVADLLSQYRLATVTGPGGVGKTRLAAEVAQHVAGRFADGVWLVELARVQEPALLQAAVATAGTASGAWDLHPGFADRGAGASADAAGDRPTALNANPVGTIE